MTIGEVCDRLSICKLKDTRTELDVHAELNELRKATTGYKDIEIYIDQLYTTNGDIWDLESDIRQGKEGILGLEEVGRRALRIRNLNSVRIQIKNTINDLYNEGYTETKSDHASE